ncbi:MULTISPECIES: autotransporter assembly complex protein TamB [Dickeya]|uniref:Translocation and assembly module for autotransporter export inner membrane subunit n=1 Tax=Dickeya aquatica TaxID=1401087 RepID=A0A375AEQ3_9GAMM|nr:MULTISPECIES: translocation/assembly module TamB domain-containing protein [Dickeya]SLM64386.1 Translocation and assembly module for autotransporter export; inner membrane subunit [Dickeya aquatica]
MSKIKQAGIGLTLLLLTVLLLLAWLISTATGLHLLLTTATRWVPGLTIEQVEGDLTALTLQDIRYQTTGVSVEVQALHLAVQPSCLWHSQVCLDEVSLQRLRVRVDSSQQTPAAAEAASSPTESDGRAPVAIALRHLRLSDSQIVIDGTAITLGTLQTGVNWQGRALTLLPTQLTGLELTVPPASSAPARPPAEAAVALGERLRALFATPLLPAMPAFSLPLDLTIDDFRGEDWRIQGEQPLRISNVQLQAQTRKQALVLQQLRVVLPQGTLSAQGEMSFTDDWPLTLTANVIVSDEVLSGERIRLTAAGSLRQQLQVMMNLSGPQSAQLSIETSLAEAGLPLAINLSSPQLRWPLTGEALYQFKQLQLTLGGRATDYALSLRTDIAGQALPPATLTLDGNGSEQQFTFRQLQLAALQGTANISGELAWPDALHWRTELALSGINSAQQWPQWPVRLDGSLSTRGSLSATHWQLDIPQLNLDGQVRQNRVAVKGTLSGDDSGQWSIPGVVVALGRNQLSLQGRVGEQWQLDGQLNAPSLNGLLPELAGKITGNVRISGSREQPHLQTSLDASGLRWQQLRIGQLTLTGDVQTGQQVRGSLALQVQQLTQDEWRLASVSLRATGDENQHQLRVMIKGEPLSGQWLLNGHVDRARQRWQGELTDTRFNTPVGEWRLVPSLALAYQATTQVLTLGAHCWRHPEAELCVPQPIAAGASGKATLALNRFNLSILKPFISPQTAVSGNITGNAQVSWQPGDGLPDARLKLNGSGVSVRQALQGGAALPVTFNTLTLDAALQRGQARLAWLAGIEGNGRIRGDIQITDPQQRRALGGTLSINDVSLALLKPMLRQNENANGMMNADLRFGGSVAHPQVFGQLALTGLSAQSNVIPVDLNQGQLTFIFNGMSSSLQGVLASAQGQINLAGNADWSQPQAWRARLAVKGERMRVTVPPMARLDVSPDIVFDASPQLLALNGTVTIPWARIVVHEMPQSTVAVSDDEVMLDAQHRPATTAGASIPIVSNLIVRVGEDVWLDAYGLRARLRGDLNVTQDTQGLGLNGQIVMPEGRFKAYGQDLQVRKGQLLFAGPPTQPVLNIEAIRNPDNTADSVTVGVRITGPAATPKLEVFSEPTLSQQEALSYLLRGQGLNSTGTDSAMMTSALIGLGVAQSGQVVGKIGEAFGVSNLALDTQGVGDKSQVVVSGYVLPGLQVKYGVGLFDSLATLTLRYRLMPKLYLEAVSGVSQALDVLYQFEF